MGYSMYGVPEKITAKAQGAVFVSIYVICITNITVFKTIFVYIYPMCWNFVNICEYA